jgi:hypothetical protein
MSTFVRYAGFCLGMAIVGCGNDSVSPSDMGQEASADASTVDAGSDAPRARPTDPFNGDCSTARWANLSDECWSCFCNTCQDTLNQCNDDCVKGLACGTDNHVLAGVTTDLVCEGRAFGAVCESDPAIHAVADLITKFDICLIGSRDPVKNHLRACEAECSITYTGDVCERFPEPPDGG